MPGAGSIPSVARPAMLIRTALGLILCGLLAPAWSAADDAALYHQRLMTRERMRPELKAAVADLQAALQQMTGAEFSPTTATQPGGICLANENDEHTPAEAKKLLPA